MSQKKIFRSLHVARNGKVLRAYHETQLPGLLDTGELRSDDVCYDDIEGRWVPLEEFAKTIQLPKYAVKAPVGTDAEAITSLEPERPPFPWARFMAVTGWLAAFLCLGVAGFFYYGSWSYQDAIAAMERKTLRLETELAALNRQYQDILFAAREVADPNVVRGKVIIKDGEGKRVAMPGIKLYLYSRAALQDFLLAQAEQRALAGASGDATRIAASLMAAMPVPLATATTDSDGRYEMKVPEPGRYVIYTSMVGRGEHGAEVRLWFVGFDSTDPLNTGVDITENQVARDFNPLFTIVEGR